MIRLTGRLIAANAAQAALIRSHLPGHVAATRAEPGCVLFEVTETAGLIWQVRESFHDQAAFDHHQVRTRASVWFAATANIQRDFTVTKD